MENFNAMFFLLRYSSSDIFLFDDTIRIEEKNKKYQCQF